MVRCEAAKLGIDHYVINRSSGNGKYATLLKNLQGT